MEVNELLAVVYILPILEEVEAEGPQDLAVNVDDVSLFWINE